MGTGSRLVREIEDIDRVLQRIIREIDAGRANFTDVRRDLAHLRSNDLVELDRLARRVKRDLRD